MLAFALSFLVLYTWTAWQEAQLEGVPRGETQAEQQARAGARPEAPGFSPESGEAGAGEFGSDPDAFSALPDAGDQPPAFQPEEEDVFEEGMGLRLVRDLPLYRVAFNSVGGRIQHWELKEYTDKEGARVALLDESIGGGALTPFASLELGNLATAVWRVARDDPYEVAFELERAGVRSFASARST